MQGNVACHKVGQCQPRIIIGENLVGPHLQCPKVIGLLGPEKKIFKGFYHIQCMGLVAILVMYQNNLYKCWLTYHKETSYEI